MVDTFSLGKIHHPHIFIAIVGIWDAKLSTFHMLRPDDIRHATHAPLASCGDTPTPIYQYQRRDGKPMSNFDFTTVARCPICNPTGKFIDNTRNRKLTQS